MEQNTNTIKRTKQAGKFFYNKRFYNTNTNIYANEKVPAITKCLSYKVFVSQKQTKFFKKTPICLILQNLKIA